MEPDTEIDEPAGTFCPKCLQRPAAPVWAVRAAWAAAGVGLVLLVSALPIACAAGCHAGPAFLRSPEGLAGMVISSMVLGVASVFGAGVCFQEARRA